MSNTWDIKTIRKLAGLPAAKPLMESEDDDDMTPAERELARKAEEGLKKGGVKVPKVDAEKDLSRLARKEKGKEERAEAASDKEEKESAAASKAEAAAEDKERKETEKVGLSAKSAQKQERKEAAKAESEKREEKSAPASKKVPQLRSWVEKNGLDRKGAWAYAQSIGMTPASFSTAYQSIKGKKQAATEAFVLLHPTVPNFLLAENREMGIHQWVDMNSPFEPLVFFTEKEAKDLAKYMAEWKGQLAHIQRVSLTEEEDDNEKDSKALEKVGAARSWLKANPGKSADEFAEHMAKEHGWAKHTAHSSYTALKK